MPACLTRYASTMSALLTSARTDSSMTVKAKLFINAEPGAIAHGHVRELIRSWPNLTETTVSGVHFVQEDSPDEIGTAIAEFVRKY